MKRLLTLSLILCLALSSQGQDTTRPWTFWYWMYGAVSEAGVKADLQAMKDVGLGGCYLMPIRSAAERPKFRGDADALSDKFWHMVDVSFAQADSLGLEMGIHICDGFALAGGPWITPAESMQKIVFCDTLIAGGSHQFRMAKPQHNNNYYEDIAVYAIPIHDRNVVMADNWDIKQQPKPIVSYSPEVTINAKGVYCADLPCWIQYDFGEPTLVRNIEVTPSGTNIQSQRLLVKASDDGVVFYPVKQLAPPRQGWQNTGFNTTFSLPPTMARYFRMEWTPEGTEPGAEDLDAAKWKAVLRLKDIKFGSWPLLDNWEGKAGYVWRIAPDTPVEDVAKDDYLHPDEILQTTVQGDFVTLELPEGQWRILRMGHTSTGHTNATAGGAKGLECDKFSRQAVEKQVDNWFGVFKKRPHSNVVKYLHVDSWECGSQNWGYRFAEEFKQRRGYDLLPLLPIYAGVPMKGGDKTLRDIRKTINELINEVFFVTVAQKAKDYGVQFSSESVAPTMVSDGMEHYKFVNQPMGEFWLNSPTHDKPNDMLDAISGGRVYGKNVIQAEGFTELRGVWDETPAMVKPLLDRNFALGINRLFFHVNTHNPWLDRKPGMTLDGIGLFFQRDQTWFPEAKAFVDYITRCQTLLQMGKPVVDIAVFTGEEMPRRAFTPDRLVPMLPGLFGAERVASEQKRLANIGQPMTESPVGVRHSAGIIDLKDWINALHGYQYDSMNKDALLTQPFNYKVLVVPEGMRTSLQVRSRLAELAEQGVLILHKPYEKSTFNNLPPDAVLPEGIAFTHRQTQDGDIYFLANQQDKAVTFQPVFRAQQQQAMCYNPVNNELVKYDNGSLTLPPYGSLFVIYGQEPCIQGVYKLFTQGIQTVYTTKTIDEPYTLSFRESGLTLKKQRLFDWSQHSDDRIRYFSGHCRYTTTFKHHVREAKQVVLSLPSVKDIAHVWVNGHDCGIAWTEPYELDITKAVKKGKNTLEIEVVNTWHNALRGADMNKAPYGGIWTNAKYRTKGDQLLPAGLLAEPVIMIKNK